MIISRENEAGGQLSALLASASIEVTPRAASAVQALRQDFAAGIDVHVTFLPDDDPKAAQDTCIELRQAGFNPVPHLTARNFVDRAALEDHLSRLAAGAQVTRALVIAGDVDRPRGPFTCGSDLLRTGLLEQYGIRSVRLAGHPEGHPRVEDAVLDAALVEKTALAREHGLEPEIVTQFSFEAEPIIAWLTRLRRLGIDAPVRIGVAGPAGTATLLKFAVRCGVGNSLRMLKNRGTQLGKLLGDTTPDGLLADLSARLAAESLGPIAGLHLYMFSGAHKVSQWLNDARSRAAREASPQTVGAGT